MEYCLPPGSRLSTPALLTRMSILPKRSMVAFTIAWTSCHFATSARMGTASPPAFSISALTALIDSSLLPARTTLAPRAASARETPLPMPLPAPVTILTFAEKSMGESPSVFVLSHNESRCPVSSIILQDYAFPCQYVLPHRRDEGTLDLLCL